MARRASPAGALRGRGPVPAPGRRPVRLPWRTWRPAAEGLDWGAAAGGSARTSHAQPSRARAWTRDSVSIGTRLVIFLVVPLVIVMALFGYLSQRSSRHLLEEELSREGRALSRTVQWTMEDAVRDGQLENTRELTDKITGYERVLGLRIFDRDGKLYYQSPNLEPYPQRQLASLATVLKERRSVETRMLVRDQPVVSFFLPLSTPGGDLFGAVQVLQLDLFVQQAVKASNNAVAALTAVMIVAMAAVVLIVTRVSVARPIEDLVRSFRAVGAGDLRSRMIVRREDEFGRLALEFNQMGERLERTRQSLLQEQEERRRVEERLRNAERLASLGRLAAGLAHEIGTPLNVIGGRAEALLRRMSGNDLAEKHLGIIATQIDRIARIVRGMLDFARARELSLAPTDVAAVIRRVIELLDQRLEASRVEVALDVPARCLRSRRTPISSSRCSSTSPPMPSTRCRAAAGCW
jgi:two-component system, NtrC family, sensor histidine kinase HydH